MEKLLQYLSMVTDKQQEKKVLHKMSDIIARAFFAMLAGADEWTEYEIFGKGHRGFFREVSETALWYTLP